MASVQAGRHAPASMGLLACVVVESCAELGCSGGWVRFAMRATRPSGEEFSARSQFALVDVVTACVLHLACALAPKAGRDQSAILAQVDTQELTASPVCFSMPDSHWWCDVVAVSCGNCGSGYCSSAFTCSCDATYLNQPVGVAPNAITNCHTPLCAFDCGVNGVCTAFGSTHACLGVHSCFVQYA